MQTGLDRLVEQPETRKFLGNGRLGLLAHPASVTRSLAHARDVLDGIGCSPRIIFGPEHGYGGEAQDMVGVGDATDRHGTPVRSLYGDEFEDLIPKKADLDGIDTLVIDLQDVGSRYYTFVWTAVLAMRAAVAIGKRVLVLDRPNPIGHGLAQVEGRLLPNALRSFVGLEPVPVRHSLTLGEIVGWRASEESLPTDQVRIVAHRALSPLAHAPQWDRPFVPTSPNMPTYDTALVYPGGCLFEGTNLSEGRGTTRPFEVVGAPFLDGFAMARDLADLNLPGVRFRPVVFLPTFQKHAGKPCGGVQVHPTDREVFRPLATYVAVLASAFRQRPEQCAFRTERYEFVDDIPAIDLLLGVPEARRWLAEGRDVRAILADCVEPTALEFEAHQLAKRQAEPYFV
jgi:uncharacterized protein YbbC (DUF1343 family)